MPECIALDEMRALTDSQAHAELAKKLEKIHIQKLTAEEQREVVELFSALPQEMIDASVELCYKLATLKIQTGDLDEARKRYNHLVSVRDGIKDKSTERRILENRIFCLSLCMPAGSDFNLLLSLAVLANEASEARFPVARVSATGKFPSVLRGAKDLSVLGKHYKAAASITRPLLCAFLEDDGNGVCETAIAELLYEKNDINGASLQAAGAINADNPEIAFAALSILARINAVDVTAKPPEEILDYIGDMLEKKNAHWLIPNFKALRVRFHILRGDLEKTREWMSECGLNDLDGFILRDSYAMITRAKACIALGEYGNAATLLERLAIDMQKQHRLLDTIECLVNGAIACELLGSGELALQKLEQALLLGQEYGYVRVFADCGKQMFHLMARYDREKHTDGDISDKYIKKIIDSSRIFSTLYPALYNVRSTGADTVREELTQSEIHILQLLDEGASNKVIAEKLHISNSTVKSHVSHIFTKLNAANRVEAIKNARNLGILA